MTGWIFQILVVAMVIAGITTAGFFADKQDPEN